MKTGILIPCMDTVHTQFHISLLRLIRDPDTVISHAVSSLVYDSRNALAEAAVKQGYDRVLWLDSDMVFDPDLMQRLSARLDEGYEMVSGLYTTRKNPIMPCIFSDIEPGKPAPFMKEYPDDAIFEVAACGFGAVMMNVSLIREVGEVYGRPFSPVVGLGEDLSFCARVNDLGKKIWCDSGIKLKHIGTHEYTVEDIE